MGIVVYKVSGINQVFWRAAKDNISSENFEDLCNQLTDRIYDYLGHKLTNITEYSLVQLACSAYADMCANIVVPAHLTETMFRIIYGDKVIELVYGPDNRSTNERIIVGILTAFQLTQIYNDQKHCLVDFGQTSPTTIGAPE